MRPRKQILLFGKPGELRSEYELRLKVWGYDVREPGDKLRHCRAALIYDATDTAIIACSVLTDAPMIAICADGTARDKATSLGAVTAYSHSTTETYGFQNRLRLRLEVVTSRRVGPHAEDSESDPWNHRYRALAAFSDTGGMDAR